MKVIYGVHNFNTNTNTNTNTNIFTKRKTPITLDMVLFLIQFNLDRENV